MQLLGYGRTAWSKISGRGPAITGVVFDTAVSAGGGFLAGYLSASSNISGGAGKILGLPIPLAGGLVLMGLGAAGVGGSYTSQILNAAKGMLAAQAAMEGIKYKYNAAGVTPAVVAALPGGTVRYLGAGMGATPQVAELFKEAGLTAR